MSLFCSKLWEFSAADQILNLGWFKAYLSSLWTFVPHPQTFSSDICFLWRIILAAFPNYGFDCQINTRSGSGAGSFPGQVFGSNPGPSPTSVILSSHLLFNFTFFLFQRRVKRSAERCWSHLQWSPCLDWMEPANEIFKQTSTHTGTNSFSQCRVLLTKATVTFSPVQQVGLYVSCQRGFKQGKDKFKKRGVSNRKGLHSILSTRAFPKLFINLPNILIVVLTTLHSHYFSLEPHVHSKIFKCLLAIFHWLLFCQMMPLFDHMFECLFKGKWQTVPQSQQRWLFPDSRWSQPLPLPSACCLTRNSFRPGAVSSLRAFHGFLRRSFPPLLHAFLHQRTAATPTVWFLLISHFFLHNYSTLFLGQFFGNSILSLLKKSCSLSID